jgi:hypothetical protein
MNNGLQMMWENAVITHCPEYNAKEQNSDCPDKDSTN